MKIGKVPNSLLNEIVLKNIKKNRDEIILRPKIGEDCSAVDFGEDVCVLSTDPITGASHEVGRLAVHVSCNDIASCGVEPLGILVTILAPPGTNEEDLEILMGQLNETANSLNVDIIGGHTEVTSAVNRFVVTTTAIGKVPKNKMVATSGAVPGDAIVMTKSAGIEGTAIIANDKEMELREKLDKSIIESAKGFVDRISVVKEGIIAGKFGVNSMHDVTEGGVLGAVWEIAEASGVGFTVFRNKIPIEFETLEIAHIYRIDPLKLISSGSMLITCKDGEGLVRVLSENGIKASVIGEITAGNKRIVKDGDLTMEIAEPESDELYRVL